MVVQPDGKVVLGVVFYFTIVESFASTAPTA